MSDKFKNSKFYKTMKNPKVSRALYLSLVVLIVAIAVIVAMTTAANRSKKNENQQQSTPSTTVPNVSDKTPTTQAPDQNDTTTSGTGDIKDPTTSVSGEVPMLSLPVSGNATKLHDAKLQVFSETMNDYRVHLGIDIATTVGAPVYAAADGKIEKIWKDPMMGYCVAITHAGDAVTVYKNLNDTLPDGIVAGAKVKTGQQIASVGESAIVEVADEPHLHFEMTVGGILVDPVEYFKAEDLSTLKIDSSYED